MPCFRPPAVLRIAALALVALAPDASIAQVDDIRTVSWLSGCWILSRGDRVVEERWMPPRGDAMVGVSRTTAGPSLRGVELIVVRADSTGLVYRADPSGQASTEFRATEASKQRVIFENPDHDFPQTIGYERRGADSLMAWIGGTSGGSIRRIPFPYARTTCDGADLSDVVADVEAFLETVVSDLRERGPLAWLDHMDPGVEFSMASDGLEVFPDFAAADRKVSELADTYTSIELFLDDPDVYPVTVDFARFASPYRETIHEAAGGSIAFGGYVTGSVARSGGRWVIRHLHWSSPVMGEDPD